MPRFSTFPSGSCRELCGFDEKGSGHEALRSRDEAYAQPLSGATVRGQYPNRRDKAVVSTARAPRRWLHICSHASTARSECEKKVKHASRGFAPPRPSPRTIAFGGDSPPGFNCPSSATIRELQESCGAPGPLALNGAVIVRSERPTQTCLRTFGAEPRSIVRK